MASFLEVSDNMAPLEKSIFLARHITHAIDVLRPLVYQVYKNELWKGKFSSFAEYVESPEGLGKSQGYINRLRQVEQFRIDSGFSPEQLQGIDHESVYLALKSGGTPEEIVQKAKTLTRAELRAEREETKDHVHEAINICKTCGIRL